MISAGIEYAKGNSDLTALATISDTNYANRSAALNALGLANTVVFHNFNLTYTRQINPNLSVTGQLGLVGVTNAFTLGLPKTLLPTLFAGRLMDDHAEGDAVGDRQPDSRAPDDGYRQRRGGVSTRT